MKKLIDFDELFDRKLAQYMEEHADEYTEKQWEDLIPRLYRNFGDTLIKSVGTTPKGYYASMTDVELVEALKAHHEEGVSVSDFLCRELESRHCPDALLSLLKEADGELLTLAVNLAGSSKRALPVYLDLLISTDDEELKDTVTEYLKGSADAVKDRVLSLYREGVEREYMLEILSRCRQRDDEVFEILLNEFRTAPDDIPMHASYLASYGDERALPVLLDYIDRDEINYLEYQELKYAIEALGGEYTKVRDFSGDAYFQEIAAQSQIMPDFTSDKKTDA